MTVSAPASFWSTTPLAIKLVKTRDHDNELGRHGGSHGDPERDGEILGLVAEHVSDLTTTRPEQIAPIPVWLPRTPYLGAIVQTDQGIVQLIVGEKVREASIRSPDLGQAESVKSIPEA